MDEYKAAWENPWKRDAQNARSLSVPAGRGCSLDEPAAASEYLREENRVLREQLGQRRLRFNDEQRRRLAVRGKALGRKLLTQVATLVTPDTVLAWHRKLIANKYDGHDKRKPGRPRKRSKSWCSHAKGKTRLGAIVASSAQRRTWASDSLQHDLTYSSPARNRASS